MISDILRTMTMNLQRANDRKGKRRSEQKTVVQMQRHLDDSLDAVGGDQTKLTALLGLYVFKVGKANASYFGFSRFVRNNVHRSLKDLDNEFWSLNVF